MARGIGRHPLPGDEELVGPFHDVLSTCHVACSFSSRR
jgi:hypothetical protein